MKIGRVLAVSEVVKRRYTSPAREEAARRTRTRIRDAAGELFAQQGYAATSVRQIAESAGVAVRTVFAVYAGGKPQLFDEALAVALGGDEALIPLAERPATLAALEARDATQVLDAVADFSCRLYGRAGALITAYQESCGADAEMRRHAEVGLSNAAAIMQVIARDLHRRQVLLPGLTPERATDLLLALCSPQTYRLLRHERDWTPDDYRLWLASTLKTALLGTRPGSSPS